MDFDINELIKTATQNLNLKDFKGDIVAVKVVENEFGTIEQGGIGVQNVYYNGNKTEAKSQHEKDVREVLNGMLEECDESGNLIFTERYQWYAVYRVLSELRNYPTKMTDFLVAMKELGSDDMKVPCTYSSLTKASKDCPKLTCKVNLWQQFAHINEMYSKLCNVCDYLIKTQD